jgi:hypothetical protein
MRRVILLKTPTVFWLGGGNISLSCSMYMGLIMLDRQKYTQQNHQCQRRVTFSSRWLLKRKAKKRHKSPGIDQIAAELIKAGGETIRYEKKLLGIISVVFNATEQLLITYSGFVKYLRKNGNTIEQCISYL